MVNFYTDVRCLGNNILFRGIVDGKRVNSRIEYSPSLYLPTRRKSEYKTLFDEPLERKLFGDIREARDYIKQFDGVSNALNIYGNTRYEYAYIAENYPGMVEWDLNLLRIAIIDIEVGSENGFPEPEDANEPITAICVKFVGGKTYVFGCGDYVTQGDEIYVKCVDEWTLCKRFLQLWSSDYPDIVSGWNVEFFDIPYLVNRLTKILGEKEVKSLSPWKYISKKNSVVMGRELSTYDIAGVDCLDYIQLYKWYSPEGKSQESYKLDNIANIELGEKKLSYDEYDNLHELYRLNFQKFIEYNIKDVMLILKMDEKLKLLELAVTLAYDTKSNFTDVFAQTRMWDALTYNYLLERNIIVPPKEIKEKDSAFEGAYVKDPLIGRHRWIAAFDLDSLYPHLMMQYSISPENLVERSEIVERKRKLIEELRLRNAK